MRLHGLHKSDGGDYVCMSEFILRSDVIPPEISNGFIFGKDD